MTPKKRTKELARSKNRNRKPLTTITFIYYKYV